MALGTEKAESGLISCVSGVRVEGLGSHPDKSVVVCEEGFGLAVASLAEIPEIPE